MGAADTGAPGNPHFIRQFTPRMGAACVAQVTANNLAGWSDKEPGGTVAI